MDFWTWGGPGVLAALIAGAVLLFLFRPRPKRKKRRRGSNTDGGDTPAESVSRRSGRHSADDKEGSGFGDSGFSDGGDGGGGGGGD